MDNFRGITPQWVKDAIFYQIFPDRFAFSQDVEKPHNIEPWDSPPTPHGFKGGDLLGVAERLDYLQDLGINAIYFNPIFQSASNHRYHTHDYYRVDPILGGDQAFRVLLEEAHRRGIRVILDGVFNHASRGFFQFNHILETGESSPYLDWFDVHGFPVNAYNCETNEANYRCWVGLPALPSFNFRNPQVRRFILDVARYWLVQGIDGWRLDVPYEIKDDAFWREFRSVVKSANPEAYIVGEIAWEAQHWLQGDMFDAVMNYQFMQACLGFFTGAQIDRPVEHNMMGLPATPVLDAAGFARRTVELLKIYPHEIALAQMNLLDSHDMPRFITLSRGDFSALRLATLFMMTYPGAPTIYYGDEVGMQGGKSNYPEASRASFPWDPEQWDQDLLAYFRECITLRKAYPALRRGKYQPLLAEGQVFAFLRELEGQALVVVLNAGSQPYTGSIALEADAAGGQSWKAVFGSGEITTRAGRLEGIQAPARSGAVFLRQNENH